MPKAFLFYNIQEHMRVTGLTLMNNAIRFVLQTLPFGCLAQGWTQLPDLPAQKRDDGVAIAAGTTLYFGTGLREGAGLGEDFYALDISSNSWRKTTALPSGAQRQYAGAFKTPNGFCVIGGEGINGPLNNVYCYDAVADSWQEKAPRPGAGILGMCCLEFEDRMILVGERFPDGSLSREVWEYRTATDHWSRKRDVPFGGRWRASATVYNVPQS